MSKDIIYKIFKVSEPEYPDLSMHRYWVIRKKEKGKPFTDLKDDEGNVLEFLTFDEVAEYFDTLTKKEETNAH